jgi:hypothetical protein
MKEVNRKSKGEFAMNMDSFNKMKTRSDAASYASEFSCDKRFFVALIADTVVKTVSLFVVALIRLIYCVRTKSVRICRQVLILIVSSDSSVPKKQSAAFSRLLSVN